MPNFKPGDMIVNTYDRLDLLIVAKIIRNKYQLIDLVYIKDESAGVVKYPTEWIDKQYEKLNYSEDLFNILDIANASFKQFIKFMEHQIDV